MQRPVISMHGPWANWVALRWKTIETRTHQRLKSLVGKRIGIHVTVEWDDQAIKLARPYLSENQILASESFLKIGGAIICTAVVQTHRLLTAADSQAALIDCGSFRRYGLELVDVRSIEAIPILGKQGIWYHDFIEEIPAHESRSETEQLP